MKIVVDIPKYVYDTCKDLSLVADADVEKVGKAIANSTPLPKGHGRMIDADAFERRCMFDINIEDIQDVIYALRDYKPIIEADKAESEVKA